MRICEVCSVEYRCVCGWMLTLECVCGGEGKTVGLLLCYSPSFPLQTVFLTGPAARLVTSKLQRASCLLSLHHWDYKCMQSNLVFFLGGGMLEFELRSLSLNSNCSFLPTESSCQPHQVTTDVVSSPPLKGKIKVFHAWCYLSRPNS